MNSDLGWLTLSFGTITMRNVPREEGAAYNQIMNNVAMLMGVVLTHYLVLVLYGTLGRRRYDAVRSKCIRTLCGTSGWARCHPGPPPTISRAIFTAAYTTSTPTPTDKSTERPTIGLTV
jgi:hypothetical protein